MEHEMGSGRPPLSPCGFRELGAAVEADTGLEDPAEQPRSRWCSGTGAGPAPASSRAPLLGGVGTARPLRGKQGRTPRGDL